MFQAKGNAWTSARYIGPTLTGVAIAAIVVAQIASVMSPARTFPLLLYGYLVTEYSSISALIWLEQKRLAYFRVDRFTVFTLILSCFLRRRLGIPGEAYLLLIVALVGLSLLFFVILRRDVIPKSSIRSAAFGLIAGVICLVPTGAIEWLNIAFLHMLGWPISTRLGAGNVPLVGARELIYVLSFGVPLEEVLFRGFLWGYLRRAGCSENRAAWLQALADWLVHWGQLVRPLVLLLGLPLILWLATWLAGRTKQLTPSVVAHLILDAVTAAV